MTKKVVTFGEIMLRLSTPHHQRFLQASSFDASFGGGEANVAVSCSILGLDAAYVTALPDNDIAKKCARELKSLNVDVSHIQWKENSRLGVFFLESGANQRPSKVIYDRKNSAIAEAKSGDFDWAKIFKGVDWFHFTGITPAISKSCAELALEAAKAAQKAGVTVSCDLNYRAKLWDWGKSAVEVMREIAKHIDVCIANEEDCQQALGIENEADVHSGELDIAQYETLSAKVMEEYPNMKAIAITLRRSHSASHNGWGACFRDKDGFIVSQQYEITHIVDRVGGGDSFAGGLIYGLLSYKDKEEALNFAVASSCLKHSISGDFNLTCVEEARALMEGGGSGRVVR